MREPPREFWKVAYWQRMAQLRNPTSPREWKFVGEYRTGLPTAGSVAYWEYRRGREPPFPRVDPDALERLRAEIAGASNQEWSLANALNDEVRSRVAAFEDGDVGLPAELPRAICVAALTKSGRACVACASFRGAAPVSVEIGENGGDDDASEIAPVYVCGKVAKLTMVCGGSGEDVRTNDETERPRLVVYVKLTKREPIIELV